MKNYNVLVDGYNLRLLKGSGIKYYTLSLIKVLEEMGYNVNLLFDYRLKYTSNESLKKISFLESFFKESFPTKIKDIFTFNKVDSLHFNKEIFDRKFDFINNKNIYNIKGLFRKAELFAKKNFYTSINISDIDIFHTTYFLNIKLKKAKRISTIHDIIPLKLPFVSLENKEEFYNKVRFTLKNSDKIIVISETTKKDILENFDVNEDKIVNCYQSFYLPNVDKVSNRIRQFNLKEKDYFLFIGNIEPKKNVGRLIKAFFSFDNPYKLVIVGRKAWLWENELKNIDKFVKSGKLIFLNYLDREEIISLYKNAFAFIFPSLYEGFGLPVLEAMACETPVITSNVSSLPEVAGDAAIYCDPYSISSIRNAIETMINMKEEDRNRLIERGQKRVKFFNKKNYKNRLKGVYESIL